MGDVVWIVYPSRVWSQQEYSSWRHPSSCPSSSSFPEKTFSSYETYSYPISWFLLSWSSSQGSWEISSSSTTKRKTDGSSYFIMEEDHKILFGEILFFPPQQKRIGRSNLPMTAKSLAFSIFLPSGTWQVIKVKTAEILFLNQEKHENDWKVTQVIYSVMFFVRLLSCSFPLLIRNRDTVAPANWSSVKFTKNPVLLMICFLCEVFWPESRTGQLMVRWPVKSLLFKLKSLWMPIPFLP